MMEDKEIVLCEPLPTTRQLVHGFLAKFRASYKCDKYLELISAIKCLIADPGVTDLPLRLFFGKGFEGKMLLLNHSQALCLRAKAYYDDLSVKRILDKDISDEKFRNFQKAMGRIQLVDVELFRIFYVLYNSTTLRDTSIPSEAFAQAYRTYKSYELDEKERRIKDKKAKDEYDENDD